MIQFIENYWPYLFILAMMLGDWIIDVIREIKK